MDGKKDKTEFYTMQERLLLGKHYLDAFKVLMQDIIDHKDKSGYCGNEDIYDIEKYVIHSFPYLGNALLFCFYQALELFLKGFVLYKDKNYCTSHKADLLLEEFKVLYPQECALQALFGKYLVDFGQPFLKDFCNENNIENINKLYEALRYPDSKDKIINRNKILYPDLAANERHIDRMMRGELRPEKFDWYDSMLEDANEIRKRSGKLFYKIEDKPTTCCFTGHRPVVFPWGCDETDPRCVKIKEALAEKVEEAVRGGYRHFIAGGALGVDLWGGEAVARLKARLPNITLEIALPFEGLNADDAAFCALKAKADKVCIVSQAGSETEAYAQRDRWMVDRSSRLIAVYDETFGYRGGTYDTLEYARETGVEIVQIAWTGL